MHANNVREWYAFYGGEEMGISLDQASIIWDAAIKSNNVDKEIAEAGIELDVIMEKQNIIRFHNATCKSSHTDEWRFMSVPYKE